MNFINNFKEKLSTNLKFVALCSLLLQITSFFLLNLLIRSVFIYLLFIFCSIILVFIGISRYVEVKSNSIFERIINFIYLINCFPLIYIFLFLIIDALLNNPEPVEMDSKDIIFIVRDSNGNEVEKRGGELKFNIKKGEIQDSIIQVKFKE